MRIYVKEVAALIERVEDAESWNEEAEDCVSRWREEGAEITFKELELSHEDFGLELPAMATVRKRLRALDWEEKARECFASILERIEGTAGTSEKGSGKSSKASKKQEEEEQEKAHEEIKRVAEVARQKAMEVQRKAEEQQRKAQEEAKRKEDEERQRALEKKKYEEEFPFSSWPYLLVAWGIIRLGSPENVGPSSVARLSRNIAQFWLLFGAVALLKRRLSKKFRHRQIIGKQNNSIVGQLKCIASSILTLCRPYFRAMLG